MDFAKFLRAPFLQNNSGGCLSTNDSIVISNYSKKSTKSIDWLFEDIYSCVYKNFTLDGFLINFKNIVGSSPNFATKAN